MTKKYQNKNRTKPSYEDFIQPQANSGGADPSQDCDRAACDFSKGFVGYWKCVGAQANDNALLKIKQMGTWARVATFMLVLAVMLGMNSTTIITQAVLHADDLTLETMAEISPDALAYALNQMDVGE